MPSATKDLIDARVWRLAYLLTRGNEHAGTHILAKLHRASFNHHQLDAAHLDRLVIIFTRQWLEQHPSATRTPRATTASASGQDILDAPLWSAAGPAAAVLNSMPQQPLEAWLLTHIDELDERSVARAMDSSTTAARHHLAQAEQLWDTALSVGADAALAQLRQHADSLDPGPQIAAWRRAHTRARRRRRFIKLALFALGTLAGVLIALQLFGH